MLLSTTPKNIFLHHHHVTVSTPYIVFPKTCDGDGIITIDDGILMAMIENMFCYPDKRYVVACLYSQFEK